MSEKPLPGLQRGLKILQYVCSRQDSVRFKDIRCEMDNLASPTLSRILKTLLHEGWLQQDEAGSYFPGGSFLTAVKQQTCQPTVAELVEPFINELAEDSTETCAFAEYEDGQFFFACKNEQPESFCLRDIGSKGANYDLNSIPVLCLAQQDKSAWQPVLDAYMPVKQHKQLKQRLDAFAASRDEVFVCDDYKAMRYMAPLVVDNEFLGVVVLSTTIRKKQERYVDLMKKIMIKIKENI